MDSPYVDAISPEEFGVRVRFVRSGDRYAHMIAILDGAGVEIPVNESVEGTAADQWPASPPLQHLSIEEVAPGRRAALLVGMAGPHHWSASIEPVAGKAALVFDIACRVAPLSQRPTESKRDDVPPLFSQYRYFEFPKRNRVICEDSQPELVFTLSPLNATKVSSVSPDETVFHAPAAEREYGCTVRWQYVAEVKQEG